MKVSRRELAKIAGATGAIAVSWETAMAEQEQTGEVSAETVRTLLDAQGARGIYEDPEQFELLREAVASLIRVQRVLREYPIPDNQEPAITLRRD